MHKIETRQYHLHNNKVNRLISNHIKHTSSHIFSKSKIQRRNEQIKDKMIQYRRYDNEHRSVGVSIRATHLGKTIHPTSES